MAVYFSFFVCHNIKAMISLDLNDKNSCRKFYLKKEMQDGFKNQTQEDVDFAELGFGDYLNLIEDSEK